MTITGDAAARHDGQSVMCPDMVVAGNACSLNAVFRSAFFSYFDFEHAERKYQLTWLDPDLLHRIINYILNTKLDKADEQTRLTRRKSGVV